MTENYKDKVAMIVDSGGWYLELAVKLSESFKKVYYYNFWISPAPTSNPLYIGEGIDGVEKVDYLFDKVDAVKADGTPEVDIFIFPDIYSGDLQLHLEKLGRLVFGSRKSDELEIYRFASRRHLKELGLKQSEGELITGLDNLREYLKKNEDVYIKISFTRGDDECVDEQTEIFTNNGWKYFKDLLEIDKVITMNMETRETMFVKPKSIYKSYYSGDMYEIKSEKVDMLCTPKHKFFARGSSKCKFKYKSITELYSNLKSEISSFSIPIKFNWQGKKQKFHTVKECVKLNRKHDGNIVIEMDLWLEFLGWFISEGCITLAGKNKNKYRIYISQSKKENSKKYNEIELLLTKLGYNYQYDTDAGFSIYNKSLFENLKQCYTEGVCPICNKTHCSHTKQIPQYVKKLSTEQILIFLESYRKGDGGICNTEERFYSSSKQLIDDVQELILKTGRGATIKYRGKRTHTHNGKDFIDRTECGQVTITNTDATIMKKHIRVVQYSGNIYDVTVEPYHNILVRRNKKVCWCGNTWHSINYATSRQHLDNLAVRLGAKQDIMKWLVTKPIDKAIEAGIDTICIDGQYPKKCTTGIEVKDASYVCKVVDFDKIPYEIKETTDALSEDLKKYRHRNFFCTENRIQGKGKSFPIDLTMRGGIPPYEIHIELIKNLAEVIYKGASGEIVEWEIEFEYACQVTIIAHEAEEDYQCIQFPKEIKPFVKLRSFVIQDGDYYIVPSPLKLIEVGAVLGFGHTLKEAIDHCKKNAEQVKGFKIEIDTEKLDSAEKELEKAKEMGINLFEE